MRLALVFHPSVRIDMDDAYTWYETQNPGRGEDFLSSVEKVLDAIQNNPEMHAKIYGDVRRCLTRRFPYGVFYRLETDRICIVAVYHAKRDPAGWKSRV
jgi:plasmid stabilization system protein ParE